MEAETGPGRGRGGEVDIRERGVSGSVGWVGGEAQYPNKYKSRLRVL